MITVTFSKSFIFLNLIFKLISGKYDYGKKSLLLQSYTILFNHIFNSINIKRNNLESACACLSLSPRYSFVS